MYGDIKGRTIVGTKEKTNKRERGGDFSEASAYYGWKKDKTWR